MRVPSSSGLKCIVESQDEEMKSLIRDVSVLSVPQEQTQKDIVATAVAIETVFFILMIHVRQVILEQDIRLRCKFAEIRFGVAAPESVEEMASVGRQIAVSPNQGE